MRIRVLLAALAATAVASGCKYSKETVPVTRSYDAVRVPNQQRLVALAADEAVEALDFRPLAGKTVAVEVQGVFPHSNEDLLGYLTARVEAKLAKSGARVIQTAPVIVLPGTTMATAAAPPTGMTHGLQLSEKADYRLLVGVSWGGIDTRDKVRTDEPLLTKQISLGVGGLLGGLFLASLSDSSFRQNFSMGVAIAAPVGAWLWYRKDSPFPHTYTLMGRVRVLAQGFPTGEGVAFSTEARGESKLIVDETNPEGYMVAQ
jgi:hypothetical protein